MTIHASPRFARLGRRVALVLASSLIPVSAVIAEPVTFGARSLEIPAPSGFEPMSKKVPRFLEISAGYLPPGNRLAESYVLPKDGELMASGNNADIQRYFQLQVLRALDGKPISTDEFEEVTKAIEGQLETLITDANKQAAELSKQGNEAAQRTAGVDPDLSIDGMTYLGTFRREPWGLFFTTRARVTVAGEPINTTGSAAVALINHQVLYLYAYSYQDEKGPHGRAWTERAVTQWADAVYAANPEDAAVAAQADAAKPKSRLGNTMIIGGLIGAAVGIGAAILGRRKKK
jgi:hypothetical protein